jgi:diguanylate cyclase (GGDEF)-like protein
MTKQGLLARAAACWDNGRIGRSHEGLIAARRLLIEARSADDAEALAAVNRCIGWFCLQLGYNDAALQAANEARNFYAGIDDHWGHSLTLAVYSWALVESGLSDLGFESATEAAVIASRTDDLALNAFAMNCKAVALVMCQEDKLALHVLDEALVLANRSQDPSTQALTLVNSGFARTAYGSVVRAGGNQQAADELDREGLEFTFAAIRKARDAGDLWNLRTALCNGAEIHAARGEVAEAQALIAEWDELPGKTGPRENTHYLYASGDIFVQLGDNERALEVYLKALKLVTDDTHQEHKVNTLRRLCEIKSKMGDFEAALSYHRAYHDAYVSQVSERSHQRAHALDMQLQNDKLREKAAQLEAQAGLDALTGVPNRRAFDAAFGRLSHEQVVVGILDIDHFKLVNDLHSHLVGDAVLMRVAGLINSMNSGMQIYRIGGEEFALLFPGVSLDRAEPIAHRILNAVRRLNLDDVAQGLRVTVSIGLAEGGILVGTALMAEADRRLYVAKKSGRDRVIADGRSSIIAASA